MERLLKMLSDLPEPGDGESGGITAVQPIGLDGARIIKTPIK
jgi:hypothetical protein